MKSKILRSDRNEKDKKTHKEVVNQKLLSINDNFALF